MLEVEQAAATADASKVQLAVVIPTRNRASLAITAVRSLLSQTNCDLRVLVSDNSSEPADLEQLERFCREVNDPRLVYIRPPQVLVQATHWDWALQQAMERFDATHFTLHYDRKITKPGHLHYATDVAARYPGMVVTFTSDQVRDDLRPAILWQAHWSGRLYELKSSRVFETTANGQIWTAAHAYPILTNCLTPRQVLRDVQARFGDICNSSGPDSCFTYRFCATHESYLHLDLALTIAYAAYRSTGIGYLRGDHSGDFGDFVKIWGDRPWLTSAPISGMNLGQNIMFHEYTLVRNAIGADKIPPIDQQAYLKSLADDLERIADPAVRQAMEARLKEHGWSKSARRQGAGARPNVAARVHTRGRFLFARSKTAVRLQLRRLSVIMADRIGFTFTGLSGAGFASGQQALRYDLMFPARRQPGGLNLELLDAKPLADPPVTPAATPRAALNALI